MDFLTSTFPSHHLLVPPVPRAWTRGTFLVAPLANKAGRGRQARTEPLAWRERATRLSPLSERACHAPRRAPARPPAAPPPLRRRFLLPGLLFPGLSPDALPEGACAEASGSCSPPFLRGPPSFLPLSRVSLPRADGRQPSSRVVRARPLPPPLPAPGSPAGGDEAAAAAAPAAPAVAAVGAAGTRALRRGGGGGGGSAAPAAAAGFPSSLA